MGVAKETICEEIPGNGVQNGKMPVRKECHPVTIWTSFPPLSPSQKTFPTSLYLHWVNTPDELVPPRLCEKSGANATGMLSRFPGEWVPNIARLFRNNSASHLPPKSTLVISYASNFWCVLNDIPRLWKENRSTTICDKLANSIGIVHSTTGVVTITASTFSSFFLFLSTPLAKLLSQWL